MNERQLIRVIEGIGCVATFLMHFRIQKCEELLQSVPLRSDTDFYPIISKLPNDSGGLCCF